MKAYELLAKPEAWIKGRIAVDRYGNPVSESDPQACRFCLVGAICHCYDGIEYGQAINKLENAVRSGIATFNDSPSTTHNMVVELLRKLDI